MIAFKRLFLSFLCKEKSNKTAPKLFQNILINARFKIGDTIILFALIREIKQHFPLIDIDILAGKDNSFMFENNPYVSETFTLYKWVKFKKSLFDLGKLRSKNYDLVVDVSSIKFGNFLYLKLLNSKYMVTLKSSNRYNISNDYCYDLVLRISPKQHNLEHFFSVLKLLHIHFNPSMKKLDIYLKEDALLKAKQFIEQIMPKKEKSVLLNIDGSNQLRSINTKDLQQIISDVANKFQNIIFIIISTPKRRKKIQALLDAQRHHNILLSYPTRDIFDVMALVNATDIIITPDTSVIHIASALKKPFIGIYSQDPTNFSRFSPIADNYKLIFAPNTKENSIQNFDHQLLLKTLKDMLHETDS